VAQQISRLNFMNVPDVTLRDFDWRAFGPLTRTVQISGVRQTEKRTRLSDLDFLNPVPRCMATDGNVTGSSHPQPDPIATDLHDGDFDIPGDDNPVSDLP
jgi:hypothetical protein